MLISPSPKGENYPVSNGSAVAPWQWLKWFENLRAGANVVISEFDREHTVTSVSVSTALDDTHGTVVVGTDGLTITLPAASTERIGKIWTVIFSTAGTCIVACAGADTFPAITSATETSLTMTSRGESITFKCLTSTTWGIV